MCLLGLVLRDGAVDVAVHVRDEYFARPAGAPCVHQAVLCGTDLAAGGGGTWMGYCASTGVLCAVTNVRCRLAPPAGAQSRGGLVAALLRGDGAGGAPRAAPSVSFSAVAAAAAAGEAGRGLLYLGGAYSAFNIIVTRAASPCGAWPAAAYSVTNAAPNAGGGVEWVALPTGAGGGADGAWAVVEHLGDGVHVVSNGPLRAPVQWPKVAWLSEQLRTVAKAGGGGCTGATPASSPCPPSDASPAAALAPLLHRYAPPFLRAAPLDVPAPTATELNAWTPLPLHLEASLQTSILVPPTSGYGSRCITAFAQLPGGAAGVGDAPAPPQCFFAWSDLAGPPATTTCAQCLRGEALGTIGEQVQEAFSCHAAGVQWHAVRVQGPGSLET